MGWCSVSFGPALQFPRSISSQFGNPGHQVAAQLQAGFDLYAAPTFPFLRGVQVRTTRDIDFFAYADGVFDLTFSAASDFQVMERGICLQLRSDEAWCGPANAFGF